MDITDAIIRFQCRVKVYDFFLCICHSRDEASAKAKEWMKTRNPLLGGISPNEMVEIGRVEKLLDFINTAIDENNLDQGIKL